MIFDRRFACIALLAASVVGQAWADTSGPVLLTVTGLESDVEYSLSDLEALGRESFETTTIWSEGVQAFTGVSLLTLLQDLGVQDGTLLAKAINGYAVEIPVSDGVENGPIVAYYRNGEPMSVRDKGLLWLVYPFDTNPDYRSEVIFSRSIWQLDRIEIQP